MSHIQKKYILVLLIAVFTWTAGCAYDDSNISNTSNSDYPVPNNQPDSLYTKKKSFLTKAFNGVTNFFMGCDTNYVTPQKYQLTAQAELSYWHDFYSMR